MITEVADNIRELTQEGTDLCFC